jgi:uncharacterized protein YcnI
VTTRPNYQEQRENGTGTGEEKITLTAGPSAVRRTVVVAASAAALSVVASAAPASADVTVSPTQATQGDSAGVTFRVQNSRSASVSRVTVYLPEATPIDEVYPYSVPDWAPKVSMRTLGQQSGSDSDTRGTEVVAAVEWSTSPEMAPKPGQAFELSLSLNPIPVTDRLEFTVVETYSDGKVVRHGKARASVDSGASLGGPTIAVLPRTIRESRADGGTNTGQNDDPAVPGGISNEGVAGVLLAGLFAVLALVRFRRRAAPNRSSTGTDGAARS